MSRCRRCGAQFERHEEAVSPAEELGEIFAAEGYAPEELCPDCREELGAMNLLGFDE
jgi:hypothetical protein